MLDHDFQHKLHTSPTTFYLLVCAQYHPSSKIHHSACAVKEKVETHHITQSERRRYITKRAFPFRNKSLYKLLEHQIQREETFLYRKLNTKHMNIVNSVMLVIQNIYALPIYVGMCNILCIRKLQYLCNNITTSNRWFISFKFENIHQSRGTFGGVNHVCSHMKMCIKYYLM